MNLLFLLGAGRGSDRSGLRRTQRGAGTPARQLSRRTARPRFAPSRSHPKSPPHGETALARTREQSDRQLLRGEPIGSRHGLVPARLDGSCCPDAQLVLGLANGDAFTGVVGNEYDRVTPDSVPTPDNIEVLFHSPVVVKGKKSFADMTYYTASSGAGVIATCDTLWWIPHTRRSQLPCRVPPQSSRTTQSRPSAIPTTDLTKNIINRLSEIGPAAKPHPVCFRPRPIRNSQGVPQHTYGCCV